MSSIKSIRKNNVTETVYGQMKDAIVSGEWEAGKKIPSENELASIMGVSRISIRAAIQRLASIGLIESRQGEGTFVCELNGTQQLKSLIPVMALTKTDLRNVLELRMVVEGKTASLAAERCSDEVLRELKDIYRRHSESASIEDAASLDFSFHYTIAKATGNLLIEQVFSILYDTYSKAFHEIVEAMGKERALHFHGQIIQAIESGNSRLAGELMDEHVQETIVFLERESRM